jgi:CspA family cold shock protein
MEQLDMTDLSIDDGVLNEINDLDMRGEFIGQCKWFNNAYGYGFVTIWDGPQKGKDIFVHHSGIRPLNSMYKTLRKGEYIMFDIIEGEKGQQAVNVRGICNGPLLCDHVPIKKHSTNDLTSFAQQQPGLYYQGDHSGVKRKRMTTDCA